MSAFGSSPGHWRRRTQSLLAAGGGTAPAANSLLLAAVPRDGTAMIGTLGGSRQRYDGIGGGNQIRSYSAGPLSWARAKSRRFRSIWYNSSGADVNSNGMSGMLFANDGEGAWNAWQRVPAVLGSDCQLAIVALSSNTVQFSDFDINGTDLGSTFSAANYVSLYQTICSTLIAGGKAVAVVGFWERDVTAGVRGQESPEWRD